MFISFYSFLLNLISLNAPILGYLNISLTNLGSILLESIFSTLNTMVKEQLGREIYLPFIYSLFLFILLANLVVIVTIGLSFTILTGVTILSLYIHKIKFFSYFVPSVLIEVISYLARAFSLGIRLFANITFLYQMFSAGVLAFIFTLIPFSIFLALCGLELAVSFIQSYVFTLLTISYIKDAIELH
ncbi:ATPase, F0 complex, subunit A [Vararia minispora EC-137]|uniref:ATPase, F0 complex, subunit A n=1 Tax=Vararia minispora EC-137 TaxID=1314806 RepID=A0ACB8Q5F1_9AGAM|nr:ATPase, F0 complex, subunit A [Vararia minispora EC-137]